MRLGLKDQTNQEGQVLQDAIVFVEWRKVAVDTDGSKASYLGKTQFSAYEVSAGDFIDLNLISKEDVVGWIENSLTQREKNNINTILNKKIEKNKLRMVTPSWG